MFISRTRNRPFDIVFAKKCKNIRQKELNDYLQPTNCETSITIGMLVVINRLLNSTSLIASLSEHTFLFYLTTNF